MASPGKSSPWWDRNADDAGRPIRSDVRAAAVEVWDKAEYYARRALGDDSEAAELLEKVVSRVSRYLDRHHVPLPAVGVVRLLMFVFRRELRHRAIQLSRVEFVGDGNLLAELLRAPDWVEGVNRDLDFEKFLSYISEAGCTMLRLRRQEYDWEYIAGVFGISTSAAKVRLLRELRQAYLKMMGARAVPDGTDPKKDSFRGT